MKKQNFNILTISISLALAGLLAIQFYWTHESLLLANKQFEKNVRKSFHTLNRDLEKNEAEYFFKHNAKKHRKMMVWQNKLDSLKINIHNSIANSIDTFIINNGEHENIVFKQKIKIDSNGNQSELILNLDVSDSGNIHHNIEEAIDMKSRQMEHIFIEMMSSNKNTFRERIDIDSIEYQIKSALIKNGINTDFEYQLVEYGFFGSKIIQKNVEEFKDKKAYRSLLLPGMMGRGKHELILSFPNKQLFMMRNVWMMLGTSLLLIIVVVYAFYYSIKTMIKQRKVAEIKNDFISNMTHELKTPITSINLACETINDENFNFNKESVSNYLNIISDENKRLKTLVNNVLDSSFTDSDQLNLTKTKLNITDLVNEVINRFDLIIKNVNGQIELKSDNSELEVEADKFHLSNALFNLIDNAIKYSNENPKIEIRIKSNNSLLFIDIEDNGIGISKSEQTKIFTKFHRVSKGNIHDVKGFGLGLSYVKRIITLHNGDISIDSSTGKGSTFKIELPI